MAAVNLATSDEPEINSTLTFPSLTHVGKRPVVLAQYGIKGLDDREISERTLPHEASTKKTEAELVAGQQSAAAQTAQHDHGRHKGRWQQRFRKGDRLSPFHFFFEGI